MAISCDIMVGFPSEDEKSFQNTVEFLNRIKPMRMHIFSFSAREKTPLFKTRMKNHWVTYQRYNFLRKLAQDFSLQYIKRFLGKRLYMIAEEKKNGLISGYTENYIKVFLKGKVLLGEIVPVRIEKVEPTSIFARLD